jgi:transcriptional regulator of acetoin/glycerol metabolism
MLTAHANAEPLRSSVPHDDLIKQSWDRAFKFGLSPDAVEVTEVSDTDNEPSELAQAAIKVINATASTLDDTNTWISFANTSGAITYQWAANGTFRKELDRVNVVQGAVISEQVVGPSGISIALASGQPVIVTGEEHFNARWRNLVCAASPVIHPLTDQVVGAINITCRAVEENKHLKIALRTVVNGFQQILASGMRSQQRRLLDAHLTTKRLTKRPVVTFDSNTMIIEKDLEGQNITHSLVLAFIETHRPDSNRGRLPNDRMVTIVRHEGIDEERLYSLVFDPSDAIAGVPLPTLGGAEGHDPGLKLLERVERDTILATLINLKGNKSMAAETLGISRGTLYERIKQYRLTEYL